MEKEKLYNLLNNFKTKGEAYKYFNITPNSKGILRLKELSNSVNFDLNVYQQRKKPPIKYCILCGNILNKQKNFCSHSCSASYNNKMRIITEETKIKISKSLKDKYPKKIKLCKICGLEKCLNIDICKHTKKWFNNLIPFGFNINLIGKKQIYKEYYRIKEIILKEYYDNNLSPKDISLKYNYTYNSENLLHVLKGFGIKTRNLSQSTNNAILQGKNTVFIKSNSKYQFKHGWFNTWNGKRIYYRSSYELKYIKKLDKNKIDYEVEFLRLKYWNSLNCKYRISIPDIYIKKDNLIIEIKSKFTFNKQNIIDKFNEYLKLGFNIKLILEHKEYGYNDILNIEQNDYIIDYLNKK